MSNLPPECDCQALNFAQLRQKLMADNVPTKDRIRALAHARTDGLLGRRNEMCPSHGSTKPVVAKAAAAAKTLKSRGKSVAVGDLLKMLRVPRTDQRDTSHLDCLRVEVGPRVAYLPLTTLRDEGLENCAVLGALLTIEKTGDFAGNMQSRLLGLARAKQRQMNEEDGYPPWWQPMRTPEQAAHSCSPRYYDRVGYDERREWLVFPDEELL